MSEAVFGVTVLLHTSNVNEINEKVCIYWAISRDEFSTPYVVTI